MSASREAERSVRRHERRESGQKPLRPVVRHRDKAARLGHSKELGGDALGIGGEHGAEDRAHNVETAIRERQRLRIGLEPFDGDAELAAPSAPQLDHRGREVGGHHCGTETGRRDRKVAVAGCDIENLATGLEAAPLRQLNRVWLEMLGERRVVTERPHPADSGLHGRVVGHRATSYAAMSRRASTTPADPKPTTTMAIIAISPPTNTGVISGVPYNWNTDRLSAQVGHLKSGPSS